MPSDLAFLWWRNRIRTCDLCRVKAIRPNLGERPRTATAGQSTYRYTGEHPRIAASVH